MDALQLWLAEFKRNRVDIAAMQECRVPGQVDLAPLAGYKCFFSGGKTRSAGVGVAVRQSLAVCVQGVHYVSDRLLAVLFQFGDVRFTVLVAYAPAHGGGAESERRHGLAARNFWGSVEIGWCSLGTSMLV